MRTAAAMEAPENSNAGNGDGYMKKPGYYIAVMCLCITMTAGCGKGENRYTYRDAGIEALNAGDYETAIVSFDKAIEASNGMVGEFDFDVLKYRAEAEYRTADYKAAADTYGVLIAVDGERPEYLNLRCAARAQTGDWAGALEDYNRAKELDTEKTAPGRIEAMLAAGASLEQRGATAEAMTLYSGAEAEGVESAELFNRMGLCKLGEDDYGEAITYFNRGLSAIDADSVPELLFNQAVAYEYQGDFKKALELMQQYVEKHGFDEEAEREIAFLKTR